MSMEEEASLRTKIPIYVIALYFIPLLLFSGFSVMIANSWMLFTAGLVTTVIGSIFLIIKMWQWEGDIIKEVDILAHSKAAFDAKKQSPMPEVIPSAENIQPREEQINELHQEIDTLKQQSEEQGAILEEKEREGVELRQDQEELQKQFDQLQQEFLFYQEAAKGQLKQKELLITEYAQSANDLRETIEKKQKQVIKLETSIQDLTYEIKTLLNLSHEEPPKKKNTVVEQFPNPPVKKISTETIGSSNEALIQLKRCIDIAQKLTGASHIGMSSRFRDIPIDSYALDQRRLFDTLSSESSSLVFVYSQREKKMLFANNETKGLFGWSPDKFIHDFSQLVQGGLDDWNQVVSKLPATRMANLPLTIKSRSGQDQTIKCSMGLIPTGIFKNHIIGVAYLS